MYDYIYNDYYAQEVTYSGSITNCSGTATRDYFSFTVHNKPNKRSIIEGMLVINDSGYFYYELKVPNYTDIWGWLSPIRSVKNGDASAYLSNSACLEIDQKSDRSVFTIKGNSNVSGTSVIAFWVIGY